MHSELLWIWQTMLDMVMVLSSLVVLLAALIVLHACRPLEVSVRSVAAMLLAAWASIELGLALQPHTPLTLLDVIGPIAVTLWISQALARHKVNHPMRREQDFNDVVGVAYKE